MQKTDFHFCFPLKYVQINCDYIFIEEIYYIELYNSLYSFFRKFEELWGGSKTFYQDVWTYIYRDIFKENRLLLSTFGKLIDEIFLLLKYPLKPPCVLRNFYLEETFQFLKECSSTLC